MPSPKPADVDAYLAAQPAEVRAALVKVRAAMRRALPAAVEAIKYGMPAYLIDGRAVASFAGWKNHYALYFVSSTLFDSITKELKGREASKGIIRFNLDEPVPESIVKRLSEWNAAVAGDAAVSGPKKSTKPTKSKQPRKLKKTAAPGPKRKTSRAAP
jgi:uncharacterized protein YdhG (YjbR/CyaY superfamily)